MRRRRSYRLVLFSCMIILIASFSLGYCINYYRIMRNRANKPPSSVQQLTDPINNVDFTKTENDLVSEDNNPQQQDNTISQAISNDQSNKIAIGALIVFKTKFLSCSHERVENISAPEDIINLTEEEVKNVYFDWHLESFSRDEVVFNKTIEGKCEKHYILKEHDGKIGVFYQYPIDDNTIKQIINVNIEHFRQEDRQMLKSGIKVESDEELAQLIEDYSS